MHRRYVQSPLTCPAARISCRGLLCQVISLFVEDPHYGARRHPGEMKIENDLKIIFYCTSVVPLASKIERGWSLANLPWLCWGFDLKSSIWWYLNYPDGRRLPTALSLAAFSCQVRPIKVACHYRLWCSLYRTSDFLYSTRKHKV